MPIDNPTQKKIINYLKKHGRTRQTELEQKLGIEREWMRQLGIKMTRDRKNSPKSVKIEREGLYFIWEYAGDNLVRNHQLQKPKKTVRDSSR